MSEHGSSVWPIANEAAERVEEGMVVGLGTGRAAAMFVRALAARVRSGLSVRGVPTSRQTADLAQELGIRLASLDDVERIDLDVDGADEVDPSLDLIKGHGGALLRERVVASIAREFLVLVGEEKLVPRLGSRMSIPVEVVPFAAPVVLRALESMGSEVTLRMAGAEPYISDNGNQILDARFREIENAGELHRSLARLPGAVDNGLFVGMADVVLVHTADGARRRLARS